MVRQLASDCRRVNISMGLCKECDKQFHNKSNLKRHMRIMHPQVDQGYESENDDVQSTIEEDESAMDEESPTNDEQSS